MPQLIHEYSTAIAGPARSAYIARIYGEQRPDGTWAGWIEFVPAKGSSSSVVLRTGQETSQPDRRAVEYWARGLEPIYLEGALQRTERVG